MNGFLAALWVLPGQTSYALLANGADAGFYEVESAFVTDVVVPAP